MEELFRVGDRNVQRLTKLSKTFNVRVGQRLLIPVVIQFFKLSSNDQSSPPVIPAVGVEETLYFISDRRMK
jgi:hypothetical protein